MDNFIYSLSQSIFYFETPGNKLKKIHVDVNILMNTLLHFSQVSFAKARRTCTYFWLSAGVYSLMAWEDKSADPVNQCNLSHDKWLLTNAIYPSS